jgi:hypothetical protein
MQRQQAMTRTEIIEANCTRIPSDDFGQHPEIVQGYLVRKAIVRSDGLIVDWPDNFQEARKLGSE